MAGARGPLHFLLFVFLFLSPLAIAFQLPHVNPKSPGAHRDKASNTFGTIARRSVTLDLERNPNYNPNGLAEYARALRKWGAKVPKELTHTLAAMGDGGELSFVLLIDRELSAKGISANLGAADGGKGQVTADSMKNDREYLSRVGFGTPLQWLSMDLDTGSSDT